MAKTREDAKEQLELKVVSERTVVQPGEETPIEVTLTNRGKSALVVNSRLAMGYPDSTERELYCEIQGQDQRKYTAYQAFTVDYHRKSLNEKFFTKLQPGESLRKTFDLQFWYRFIQPDLYMVRLIYDPEPYQLKLKATPGPITSLPITITVRA